MRYGIPEYRLPRDILANEIKVVQDMGVEIKCGVTFGKDITLESLKKDGYAAVFMAIGLHNGSELGIENEKIAGVLQGVDFLRDSSMGKKPEIGNDVIVIGGGNVAIDVALTAKRHGAPENVTLLCLESREEMPAWEHEIEEALEGDIKIVNSFGPKSFFIDKNDKRVSGIEFKTCTKVFDENGRFNPQYDEQVCQPFFCDTVIVSIGQSTNLDGIKEQGIASPARAVWRPIPSPSRPPSTGSLPAATPSTAPNPSWMRWPAARRWPRASIASSMARISARTRQELGICPARDVQRGQETG